jgi:ABC-2 type transport system ATP-binding protein
MAHPDQIGAVRALRPMHERQILGRTIFLFDNADRRQIAALGDVHTPSIADLFVAVIGKASKQKQGEER